MSGVAGDPMEFRRALGCFATGVTVVTTVDEDGRPRGLTANAFSSLSLDPPLILVCVDHKSDSFPAMSKARAFAVNILGEDQKDVSQRFASKGVDKFEGIAYHLGASGVPILDGSLAFLECTPADTCEAGDHTIFIGNVIHLDYTQDRPLLFFRGNYASLPEATAV